jgi:hypothetical protein
MVVYHAINYSPFRPMAFEYLAFLPPSFILIAGFVVGQIYASRYDLSRWEPYRRLLIRGCKLIALFTLCNLLLYVFEYRAFGLQEGVMEFAANSPTIYLIGAGRVAVFEVLLPIGYFLVAAALLVFLSRYSRWSTWAITVAAIAVSVALEKRGLALDHWVLFTAGIIGMGLGSIPMKTINAAASRWWLVLLVYIGYRALSAWLGERYAIQMFGAAATLLLLYAFAVRCNPSRRLNAHFVVLGQYSLFAYLAQIALLQIFVRVGSPQHAWSVAILILVTLLCTSLSVIVVASLRRRSGQVDSMYKIIFA